MTFADKLHDAMMKARARDPEGKLSTDAWKKIANETAAAHFKRRKPQSAMERNRMLEALALATGSRDVSQVTPAGWRTVSKALRDIQSVNNSLSDEQLIAEIKRRAVSFKTRHPTWDLTPSSLAKWWGDFAPAAGVPDKIPAGPENWVGWLRENCEGWIRFTEESRGYAVPEWDKLRADERATILDLMRKAGVIT